jgi:hypothetical protein
MSKEQFESESEHKKDVPEKELEGRDYAISQTFEKQLWTQEGVEDIQVTKKIAEYMKQRGHIKN